MTDLFLLDALTLATGFIGITLAVGYLGLPKIPSLLLAAAVIVAGAFTGSFRRFERIAMTLCELAAADPDLLRRPPARDADGARFRRPLHARGHRRRGHPDLLIIGIVGTAVAPWQLLFQQSYVIDKRITAPGCS